jgi:RNA recognition motif-containing protein
MSSQADEVARLKAELASLQQETASLEKKPKKEKRKKKKRKSTEDDEAAKLRAELEAVEQETSALTGAPPPPEKKKRKKDKKTKADAPVDAPPACKKEPASDGAPPARRAYVGGLPFDATEESVANYFSTLCGDLEKVEIQCFEDNPERCCGIAYVTFVEPDALDRALTLDGESFKGDGRTMKIRRDRTGNKPRRPPPPRVAGSLTVYVGNMPWAASKEEVEAMLSDAGCAVSSMRYHTDAETGQFRGFVHAELADESSLSNALALAGTRWRGRELRVSHSETGKKR